MPRRTDVSVSAHIGARIKSRRKALGMSQTALARKLGLSFQQIQKYEAGADHISCDRLFQLAAALDVSLPWFFEDIAAPAPPALAA